MAEVTAVIGMFPSTWVHSNIFSFNFLSLRALINMCTDRSSGLMGEILLTLDWRTILSRVSEAGSLPS